MKRKLLEFARKNLVLTYISTVLVYLFMRYEWKKDFDEALENYEIKGLSRAEKNRLALDVVFCKLRYRMKVDEYFRYEFYYLNKAGRKQYVADSELIPKLRKQDDPDSFFILRYKDRAYEAFKKYYRRDCLKIEKQSDYEAFEEFCGKHSEFIVKPLSGSYGGRGVYKEKVADAAQCRKVFKELIKSEKTYFVEELIDQDEGMKKYHPESVNTIRLVTCNTGKEVEIVQSSVRIGMGGSVVDNGCLSSSVDLETGLITSLGRCAHRKGLYAFQPDTGEQIIGTYIPKWEELKVQIVEMANVLPKQRVIGWDMALSTKGWVMIEGNTQPAIQTLSGVGVGARELFNHLLVK